MNKRNDQYYKKFEDKLSIPLTAEPDRALDSDVALDIMFLGMRDGMFRSASLKGIKSVDDFYSARNIVNGDTKQYGKSIADTAEVFLDALVADKCPR